MLGWQRDWAAEDSYDTVMDIVKSRRRAYGVSVEYADTEPWCTARCRRSSRSTWSERQLSSNAEGAFQTPPTIKRSWV